MKQLRDRVAVVTGAASGIGRALAECFAAEGMKLVLADVAAGELEDVASELEERGARVLAVPTDVSRADDVAALAERSLKAFGAVHLVCNNAGVFAGGLSWQAPLSDWEWVLGVNVWGVIHGIRSFVPILLEQDEGHVVNTASMAAVTNGPLAGPYSASKHAVLSISETLYHELTQRGARVGVSALCPEAVTTRIGESRRNRPPEFARTPEDASAERDLVEAAIRATIERGISPEAIAERTLAAVRENRFYVLADHADSWRRACHTRLEDIRLARNPTFVVPEPEVAIPDPDATG